jgi:hypothetical protein
MKDRPRLTKIINKRINNISNEIHKESKLLIHIFLIFMTVAQH